MEKIDKMLARYGKASDRKDNWISLWQDCYDLAFPQRTGFYDNAAGQSNTDEIYDSSPVQATAEFASRMQAGLTPSFAKWFELQAGSEIPEEQASEVNRHLEDVSNYVWETLQNSNMNQELHEAYFDLAIGTGTMTIEEGIHPEDQPVEFTTLPQPQVVLDHGPFGYIDATYRARQLRLREITVIWPKAKIHGDMQTQGERDPEHMFTIIECVHRDWESRGTERHVYNVISKEPKHILLEGEYVGDGACPMLSFRWSKASGETYGRGPLLNALPDIKTLNEVVRLGLENAAMSITGMWQADDDGILNPDTIELVPGTIIPRAMNSRGLEPLVPANQSNVSQFLIQDMRHNIKKAMFNESLGAPEGTPMSATEVHERMADLSRTIGSAYGRLHTELTTPLLRRVVHILKKQGRIEIPRINGREVKVVNVSPLAQAQHNENVARVGRWLQLMNAGFGPQMTNMVVRAEEAAVYTGQQIGVPEKLIRSDAERAEIAQAIAETQELASQQQQQQGI
jgi:hypothetical protein